MLDPFGHSSMGKPSPQVTMTEKITKNFPVSDVFAKVRFTMPETTYTKREVDALIAKALAEAKAIDEASMAKHNRDATIISMILGFTVLAFFVDGLLRLLGVVPPFMGIDIDILDKITERVEGDILQNFKNVIRK
tara:strand:- start:230 stop:634 length:405 start_codon:yes stop_codon:yes gene_type:complete